MGDDLAESTMTCSMFHLIFLLKYAFCTMTLLDFSQFESETAGKGHVICHVQTPYVYSVIIGFVLVVIHRFEI